MQDYTLPNTHPQQAHLTSETFSVELLSQRVDVIVKGLNLFLLGDLSQGAISVRTVRSGAQRLQSYLCKQKEIIVLNKRAKRSPVP